MDSRLRTFGRPRSLSKWFWTCATVLTLSLSLFPTQTFAQGSAPGGSAPGGVANPPSVPSYNFSFMSAPNYFAVPANYAYRWVGTWRESMEVSSSGGCIHRNHVQTRWALYNVGNTNQPRWVGRATLLMLPEHLSGSCASRPGREITWAPRSEGDHVWNVTVRSFQVSSSGNVSGTTSNTYAWIPSPSEDGYEYFYHQVREITEDLRFDIPVFTSINSQQVLNCGYNSSAPDGLLTRTVQQESGCNSTSNTSDGRYFTSLECPGIQQVSGPFYADGLLIRSAKPCACEVTEEGVPTVDENACSDRGTPPTAAECGQSFGEAQVQNFIDLGNQRYQFDVRLTGYNQGVTRAMPADFMLATERSSRLDPATSVQLSQGLNQLHGYIAQYLAADARPDRLFKAGLVSFNADGYTHRFLADVPQTSTPATWIEPLTGACDAGFGHGISKAFSQNLAHNRRACLDSSKASRVLVILARGQEQLSPMLENTLASIQNLSQVTIFGIGLDVDHPTADLLRRVVRDRGTRKGAFYNVRDLAHLDTALENIASTFLPSGPAANLVVELPIAAPFSLRSAELFRQNGQTLEPIKTVTQSQGTGALHFNLEEALPPGQTKILRITVEMAQCLNQTVPLFSVGVARASFANACGLHHRTLTNPGSGFSPGCLSLSGNARVEGGAPLAGALIEARLGNAPVFTTVTDNSGNYLLPSLGAGSYNVRALATGYQLTPTFANPVVLTGSSAGNLNFIGMPSSSGSSSSGGQSSSASSSSGQNSSGQSSSGQSSSAHTSSQTSSSSSSPIGGSSSSAGSTSSAASSAASSVPALPTPPFGAPQPFAPTPSPGPGDPILPPSGPVTPACASLDLNSMKQQLLGNVMTARARVLRQLNAVTRVATTKEQRQMRRLTRTLNSLNTRIRGLPIRIDGTEPDSVRSQKALTVLMTRDGIDEAYNLSLRTLARRTGRPLARADRRGRARAAFDRAVQTINETLIPYLTTRCG